MKIHLKMLIGLFTLIVLGASYVFFIAQGDDALPVDMEAKIKVANESVYDNTTQNSDSSADIKIEKEARIQGLKDDVQEQYLEIVQLTGSSGQKNLSYEDNWCVASEDLTEEDAFYASNQLRDWELSRGNVIPRGGKLNELVKGLGLKNDEFPGINDEYLTSYKEEDKDTLLRLGRKDDRLALMTIVQSKDYEKFDLQTRLDVGKQLVVLGDTSFGLLQVVIHHLENAAYAKRSGKGEPKSQLKAALAAVEFGLMRQDASSLDIFLAKTADFEDRLSGLNPASLLTEQDFADIKKMANKYYDDVNKARLDKGLPSFEELDEPKIAQIQYEETLSSYYRDYPALLEGETFLSDWQDTYLKKTPCVERQLAMHNFLMTKLPDIESEIIALERDLN